MYSNRNRTFLGNNDQINFKLKLTSKGFLTEYIDLNTLMFTIIM